MPYRIAFLTFVLTGSIAGASPVLSLQQNGSAATAATYTMSTKPAMILLDVHLDTGGVRIDGLDFHINAATPYASGFAISAGQGPFSAGEVQAAPTTGAPANAASHTSMFHTTAGDYPAAADYDLLTYAFDVSALGAGSYVFTPVGNAFTDAPGGVFTSTFSPAVPFTLTISVPEPAGLAFAGLGLAMIARHRARRPVAVRCR